MVQWHWVFGSTIVARLVSSALAIGVSLKGARLLVIVVECCRKFLLVFTQLLRSQPHNVRLTVVKFIVRIFWGYCR